MKNLNDYTADELITELRKKDGGYFVTIIPKDWAEDSIGTENTSKYEQTIQEMFMESEQVSDCFIDIMDSIKRDFLN
jgi:hypothetical protein